MQTSTTCAGEETPSTWCLAQWTGRVGCGTWSHTLATRLLRTTLISSKGLLGIPLTGSFSDCYWIVCIVLPFIDQSLDYTCITSIVNTNIVRYLATQCADRSVRIYEEVLNSKCQLLHLCQYAAFNPFLTSYTSEKSKQIKFKIKHVLKKGRLFLDDTVRTFFRRPCFSPDGALLFTPCGQGI